VLAVCYARPLPGAPIAEQLAAFHAYCARSGRRPGAEYCELDAPAEGAGPGGFELRRMLRALAAEARPETEVAIAALAVFGASAREQARRYLQLAALSVPLALVDGCDPAEALLAAWAERGPGERRREQVRRGMRERALRGEVLGRPPYGYRVEGRHLAVEPVEAAVVREIVRRYLDGGEGVRRIAQALNEGGLRTRRGGPWSMVSVREVLRNPVYTGTYRRLGIVVPAEHEALMTREQFQAVQSRLAARRTSFAPQQRGEYLLAGLARCGYCGNRLIGVRRSRRAAAGAAPQVYTYYQCESRTNQSRCAYHTRRADELERRVRAFLRLAEPPPEFAGGDGARGDAAEDGAGGALEEARERVRARRVALQRQLDGLLERYASGEWSAEQLREEAGTVALLDLQAEEEEALLWHPSTAPGAGEGGGRQAGLAAARRKLVGEWSRLPLAEQRELLRRVVTGIVVMDDAIRLELAT
jgi:DNA invertase Pin-like site-specific DNA recombinase